MVNVERVLTLSAATCCLCEHPLSERELHELRGRMDDYEPYCRACLETHVGVCSECSARYTSDGICAECAVREYALAV
jgi:hypothetical protein